MNRVCECGKNIASTRELCNKCYLEKRNTDIFELKKQGFTQEAIAQKLDVSKSTVSKVIQGRKIVGSGHYERKTKEKKL